MNRTFREEVQFFPDPLKAEVSMISFDLETTGVQLADHGLQRDACSFSSATQVVLHQHPRPTFSFTSEIIETAAEGYDLGYAAVVRSMTFG